MKIKDLGLWCLLSFVLVFIVFGMLTIRTNNRIDDLQSQVELLNTELGEVDTVIQTLRNDLNDMDWYYDEYLRLRDIHANAQDTAIRNLYNEKRVNYFID